MCVNLSFINTFCSVIHTPRQKRKEHPPTHTHPTNFYKSRRHFKIYSIKIKIIFTQKIGRLSYTFSYYILKFSQFFRSYFKTVKPNLDILTTFYKNIIVFQQLRNFFCYEHFIVSTKI